MVNIKIKNIAVYHGSKIVDNSYYIEHFEKQGKHVKHLFEDVMGRKYRYLIDPKKENSLTMAIHSAKEVLKKSNLSGSDIDMIIYSSVLPEYVAPPSSLFIHNAIKGKKHCYCHDINVNCTGMVYSLDLVYRYIATNPEINTVLIIGSDYLTPQVSPSNELCYGQYGDASCAIIIERTNEPSQFLGSKIDINSDKIEDVRFPKCGSSNIYNASPEYIWAKWEAYDTTWINDVINNIRELVSQNNLNISDISMFCLSQFSFSNVKSIREKLNISADKSIYIGDRYGYTGTTSPFIVLYEAIKQGKVSRGDYILFWTVGAGNIHMASLIKY